MLPFRDEPEPVEQWVSCSCVTKRRNELLFKASHITPAFQRKRFNTFVVHDKLPIILGAYECAMAYADQFAKIHDSEQNSIALLGQPGAGKTHLLMAVANFLLDQNVPVLYFPWVEGWNEIRGDLDRMKDIIKQMQRVDVLFIDDLFKGRERPTPFQLEQSFAIINYRYQNNLPMLISSERTIGQLSDPETGDEGIGSRIYERCKAFTVVLTGRELNSRLKG